MKLKQVVAAFEPDWRDAGNGSGSYWEPYDGRSSPLNMQSGFGQLVLNLGLATGDSFYLDRAAKMAANLRGSLRLVNGAYEWGYWADSTAPTGPTYAAIDADFALSCYRAGIGFTAGDMGKFVATLRRISMYDATGNLLGLSSTINGQGTAVMNSVYEWGRFAFLDSTFYGDLAASMTKFSEAKINAWVAAYVAQTSQPFVFDHAL
jgi:hypothetical protein